MNHRSTPGCQLVAAIAAKDHRALRQLLDPAVDFRAMTPRQFWQGASPDDVSSAVSQWFDDGDDIRGVDKVASESFTDVEHVSYRLQVVSQAQTHLVDQQAYLTTRDGRITWLRIMCAGFRPIDVTSAPPTEGNPI